MPLPRLAVMLPAMPSPIRSSKLTKTPGIPVAKSMSAEPEFVAKAKDPAPKGVRLPPMIEPSVGAIGWRRRVPTQEPCCDLYHFRPVCFIMYNQVAFVKQMLKESSMGSCRAE